MTCIAGISERGRVWIGGDSSGISGWDLCVRADEKVFRNGEYVLGFSTSFRMGQLLRYGAKLPVPDSPEKMGNHVHAFMCTKFVDAVRECLKAGGYAKRENEVESCGSFLVGYRDRLFEIGSDYQVGEAQSGILAVGCGAQAALGALYAQPQAIPARKRMERALDAAEAVNAGVRGPFVVLTTVYQGLIDIEQTFEDADA